MSRELQQLVFERSRNVNVNVSVGDKAENCDPGHWTVKASSLNNRGPLSQIHSVLSFHSRQQGSTFCPSASSLAHDRQEVNEDFFFFLFSSFSRVFCTQPGGAATVKNETKKKKTNPEIQLLFTHTTNFFVSVTKLSADFRLSSDVLARFYVFVKVILKSRRHMTLIIRVFSGQKKKKDWSQSSSPRCHREKKTGTLTQSHMMSHWRSENKTGQNPGYVSARVCVLER